MPGPQISSSLESSRKHGVFICDYRMDSNKINGESIKSIFAERQYSLKEGLFGRFTNDCCQSQLVIVLNEDKTKNTSDNSSRTDFVGFVKKNSIILFKYYKGTTFPESLQIAIRPDSNLSNIQELTLHKMP